MEEPNKAQPQMRKGEATFRIKKGTKLPEKPQQQFATKTAEERATEGHTTRKQSTNEIERKQHHQHYRSQQHHTPPKVQPDKGFHILQKYNLEEATGTEKAHTGQEYIEQTHDGPDIKRLIPWRQTKAQRVGERHNTRLVEDEWTTQPAKTSDKPWTGWANFEEHQEFPTKLESDDEEQQQGTKAKAVQAPKQPTPQEILEHDVTHLPYRSWCPTCVQARGRQNNHPKQHSKLPIIQLDFGYIKGFDGSDVHPILTAIDMALQLTQKHALRLCRYTATALPQ